LIALIIDVRALGRTSLLKERWTTIEKTIVASNAPGSAAVKPRSQGPFGPAGNASIEPNERPLRVSRRIRPDEPDTFPLHDV
jgi:hypothetical protein